MYRLPGEHRGRPAPPRNNRYIYSGAAMPRMSSVRSSCARKKSVIQSRKTFFSRSSS